ncbi:MAG: AMP-binding protein [Ilumatobacter sp.]|nr:AMP-binding protein [Ilumatobacter sp.]
MATGTDEMGYLEMNLAEVIEAHDAARIALIDGDTTITFGELRDRVGAMRAHLVASGVRPGDPVAIAAGNEPLFAVASLAILGVGGIVMPLNPSSPPAELQRKLVSVAPSMVLIGEIGRRLLDHGDIITSPLVDMTTIDPADGAVPPIVGRQPGDVAFYMSTSGVSGVPKVAMLTHRNLEFVQEMSVSNENPLLDSDVTLGVLPFAHIFGLNVVLLASMRVGACVVLQRRFDVDESLRLVREHGVTMLTGAPPMWQRWADADVPDDSLRSVRRAVSGAAALPFEVFAKIRDRYGVEIEEGYGLTETSPVITSGRGAPIRATSVGKVMPDVEVVLVDPDGSPVDVGDQGEIVVRGEGVFVGYLDDPDTTASVLTEDGWFWTGDVGIFDDEGYLFLVDRVKDIVIVSGFNVYPSEVENVLIEHPDVRGALVVGSPHGETGEMVVAYVSGTADETALRAHVDSQLSRYKRPTEYHFVEELPISDNGKPRRRELR